MILSKEHSEFIRGDEVVLIHIVRYNKQIQRLLEVKDYSEQDLINGKISRNEFYKARESKIKAYSDCISTMIQKERLLQFHNSGFEIQVIQEKTEIRQARNGLDFTKLSFQEQVELLQLMQKAKKQQNYLPPIATNSTIPEVIDVEHELVVEEETNINLIKHEKPPEVIEYSNPIRSIDPTIRLRESLAKLAAKQFKEAGGTLTKDEEELIK